MYGKGSFKLKFGYARVSTQDQSLSLQLDALDRHGVDETFEEKESGKRKNRPQLEELLKVLRKGDTVVVYKLDRISRSTKHLIELMEQFEAKGIHFASIQDKIDTTTAMGRFFFRMLASIAELGVASGKCGFTTLRNFNIKESKLSI